MCLALVAMFPLTEDVGDTVEVVTGGAVAGWEAIATQEAEVERGVAPYEGVQLEAASGDAKVEDGVESV